MKLVTFDIDNQKNLIIQFPVFVQPYTQTKLTLYQIEIVPAPILDASNFLLESLATCGEHKK